MLVLTRKVDESILIGEDIKVAILGIDGDRVRVGIDAPRSMRIFRMELLNETSDLNREAVKQIATSISFAMPKEENKKE